MQTSSSRAHPSSFPYLPCLLLSFVFHLSLFLGFQRLDLMTSSSKNRPEEVISFVDLESIPSLPQKEVQKQEEEEAPDITPEAPSAVAQELSAILPPGLTAGSPPILTASLPPRPETIPGPPEALMSAQAPISTPEPTPVSTEVPPEPSDIGPEEINRGKMEDVPPPSETADPTSETGTAPAQSDPSSEPPFDPTEVIAESDEAGDPAEVAGETAEAGDLPEEIGPDGTPPLSSTPTAVVRKKVLPRKNPKKERVKKVGLLGLLGKKTPRRGSSIRNLRRPLSVGKNARRSSPGPGTGPLSENKERKTVKLRNEVLREEQNRLTRRGGSGSAQASDLRIIQGSDRNYGIISSSVQVKRSRLRTVYNEQLRNSPNLEGNVILEFVVSPEGSVLKCNVLTSSLGNPEFEKALVREILRWRFPRVKKGTTTILFPISFFPSG